jgi:hypothetical protein
MMNRYIGLFIFTSAQLLLQSQASAVTCTPPEREICYKSSCSCWGVSSYVGIDGKTVIELKGKPEQAPGVLNRLQINPKDVLKKTF